ncbi:MAG: hypothetical protein M3179_02270 [Actinomycetota bacterium]|nr:hypothetical protein [Actinomycetota bacterium]
MPTPTEITNAVEDQVLNSVRVSQKAVVDSVRSWSQTMESVFSRLPEFSFPDNQVRPTEAFERALGFTEKVVATQRDFATQLLEAAIPAAKAGASATQSAAQSASQSTNQSTRNPSAKA